MSGQIKGPDFDQTEKTWKKLQESMDFNPTEDKCNLIPLKLFQFSII